MRDKHTGYEIPPCCGTCRYHVHEDIDDGWVCTCDKSDYVAEWTDYDFYCTEWEERE